MQYRSSNLRKHRVSISGQIYSITKSVANPSRPIIADPKVPQESMENALIIIDSLRWLHGAKNITCFGYVIMPDHLHIIFGLGEEQSLADVMRSFSTYTARNINLRNDWQGQFWQPGYYEHAIRGERAFERHFKYLYENPVRKGYVDAPEKWPFGELKPDW